MKPITDQHNSHTKDGTTLLCKVETTEHTNITSLRDT